MKRFKRSLIALGIAATLPTLIFVAVGLFSVLRANRQQMEQLTLAQAQTAIDSMDAQLQKSVASLEVLATSVYFESQDWREFYPRLIRVLSANNDWRNIVVMDVARQQQILDLRQPQAAPMALPALHAAAMAQVLQTATTFVGPVQRAPEPEVWVYQPVKHGDVIAYVLAVAVKTDAFQSLLMLRTPEKMITAVVDREGNFIARSLKYVERVGTPATIYVRNALHRGNTGVYRGVTYEGTQNYTAFSKSSWTGWSAHFAVPSKLIDSRTGWLLIVSAIAGVGSLLLAAILVVMVLRDMNERRVVDEALRQSQKMEAVGQLTGGIAHDFNNLLTAVIGNLDMIRTRSVADERLHRLAGNALQAAQRGAKLASQLLAFSRYQRMQVGRVDLAALLNGVSGLLAQSIGPAIRLAFHVEPAARWVVTDPNQLELALLNLAVNARDAMPEGGTLNIIATPLAVAEPSLPKGDYVRIAVTDTGHGMVDSVRARATEPFFTTKPIGQGTGLGLSQVYGVMRESGGGMSIDSQPGVGTTVWLMLPRATEEMPAFDAPQTATIKAQAQPIATDRYIVLLDDDELVRRFMMEALQGMGYQVLAANTGAAAIELLRSRPVALLITDFAMPVMNGAEVARAAQTLQPGLPVLIVSGHADSEAIEALLGKTPQLRKPFDTQQLEQAVAALLA